MNLTEPVIKCIACGATHVRRETGNPRIGWRAVYYDCQQTKKRYTQFYAFDQKSGPLQVEALK